MKKTLFFIALTIMVLAIVPQVQAQTPQQLAELEKLGNEYAEGRINYFDYLRGMNEIMNPSDTTPVSPQLITPTGKAWVIQDNQVQGSGKAVVIKSDGGFEFYERILGIWRPNINTVYATNRYTGTGSSINITSNNNYNGLAGSANYTISGNGSTLTISGDDPNTPIYGTYTLRDMPRVKAAGGNIVNRTGTAWQDNYGGRSHYIYHTDGIMYSYGGSGLGPWDFNDNWNTYTANSATGNLIQYYQDNRQNTPNEFSYSVTDFGGGNMTLRMWRVNRNSPHDEVYKLVSTPSGFRLPRVR